MIKISVCMIVKDEGMRLGACLDSLTCIADEIIIVDTGSKDDTKDVAAEYTDKIFDYPWKNDFAAARNFAFSKATGDYIYSADADEVIDSANQAKFMQLKQVILPEIDVVTMKYVNYMDINTTYNSKIELRPKLYKRLRTLKWVDPIHETVQLDPIVYDSDIEIMHKAHGNHAKRDIAVLLNTFDSGKPFSKKLHSMYAKELFIAGDDTDFLKATHVFEATLTDPLRSQDERDEAACVLARCYRLSGDTDDFFKVCLKNIAITPCAEICMELGEYFFSRGDFDEAAIWFQNAATETESFVYVRSSGDLPLLRMAACYKELSYKMANSDPMMSRQYIAEAEKLEDQAEKWEMPEEL